MATSTARRVLAPLAATVGGVATYAALQWQSAHASGDALSAPDIDWEHHGFFSGYDHAAVRRGFEVYRAVCSSCHSIDRLAYRELVGVAYTEEEAKAIAAEVEIEDGPDDKGNMFTRPGKLSDTIKAPYRNDEQARAANNNALPPDLSLIVKARPEHENYIFALLTGYREAPAGVEVDEPLHYNPYFVGGKIAMAQALYDGAVEYDDGTPVTASQLAKDVTIFLAWVSEPEMEERKQMGVKVVAMLAVMSAFALYYKRFKWTTIKNRIMVYGK